MAPSASPKLGRRTHPAELDCEIYQAVGANPAAVALAPSAMKTAKLDFGAGEGHPLQHIRAQGMPERHTSGLCYPQGPPGGIHTLGLLPAWTQFSGGWAPGVQPGSASRPHPLFCPCHSACFFPSLLPKCPVLAASSHFPNSAWDPPRGLLFS